MKNAETQWMETRRPMSGSSPEGDAPSPSPEASSAARNASSPSCDAEEVIREAKEYIGELFRGESGGHDAEHSLRVYRNALLIAADEPGCDRLVVALAALLHDADDHKLFSTEGNANARAFLKRAQLPEDMAAGILSAINSVSFSRNRGTRPESAEGRIVQDADRLDAMGAVGAARTFAYGGAHGRSMEDSLRHFDEKLLLLKDLMNTETGKRLAEERHAFLERFEAMYRIETGQWEGAADVLADKKRIRRMIRERKRQMSEKEIVDASRVLTGACLSTREWKEADTVLLYITHKQEVRTAALFAAAWEEGKNVAVPKIVGGEMIFVRMTRESTIRAGACGIMEAEGEPPMKFSGKTLMVMPGVAFDREGRRIGYGGGYYDRCLAAHPDLPRIALCYDFQLLEHVPGGEQDMPVDMVITCSEQLRFTGRP